MTPPHLARPPGYESTIADLWNCLEAAAYIARRLHIAEDEIEAARCTIIRSVIQTQESQCAESS